MAFDFRKLPRCGAKARSNHHKPCRQAAMPNGRCYLAWWGNVDKAWSLHKEGSKLSALRVEF